MVAIQLVFKMNLNKNILILLLFLQASFLIRAQTIATVEISLSKATAGLDIPTSISLDEITFLPDSVLSLVAVQGNNKTVVPFQIIQAI